MPNTRPLHVLVVAPGRRPAGVLERALLRLRDEGHPPHEIHVVAPGPLIDEVRCDLLEGGRFARFCAAQGLDRDEVLFNRRTLHAVTPPAAPDCTVGADRLLALLRTLTRSRDVALTVVLCEDAGVTGHLMHACLQIVARVEDRLLLNLSNVSRRLRASCAFLEVPLLLWPPNEPVPATYAEAASRRRLDLMRLTQPDVLRLDCRTRVARVGETTVKLPAMQFFWLWYLASIPGERFPLADVTDALTNPRRLSAPITQTLTDGRSRVFPADLQRAFGQLFPKAADKFESMYVSACGPHPGLPSTISKINAGFRRALGGGAAPYLIKGGRGAGGYRITLPPSAIQIVGRG